MPLPGARAFSVVFILWFRIPTLYLRVSCSDSPIFIPRLASQTVTGGTSSWNWPAFIPKSKRQRGHECCQEPTEDRPAERRELPGWGLRLWPSLTSSLSLMSDSPQACHPSFEPSVALLGQRGWPLFIFLHGSTAFGGPNSADMDQLPFRLLSSFQGPLELELPLLASLAALFHSLADLPFGFLFIPTIWWFPFLASKLSHAGREKSL